MQSVSTTERYYARHLLPGMEVRYKDEWHMVVSVGTYRNSGCSPVTVNLLLEAFEAPHINTRHTLPESAMVTIR